ncbi:MAG TPA: hypothetical protein GXX20_07840 [Clostridiaceae bacterium]|nr:hypothetical protein [Clostridiaceae bacterium]
MKRKKNFYLGMGLLLGTAFGAALMIILFAATGNGIWISYTGVGTIVGLIIGIAMEASAAKKTSEESTEKSVQS